MSAWQVLKEAGPWVLSALVTVFGFVLTRNQSRQQTQVQYETTTQANAVVLYGSLHEDQAQTIAQLRTDLTETRSEGRETRAQLNRVLRYIREHRPWDDQIFDQARQAGWDVVPPPPLEPPQEDPQP